MNRMNYYISDLHFGHANVLMYDNRPFSNCEEMETALINNWNSVVKDSDTVYILGDVCFSKSSQDWVRILSLLKGQKYLIKGNHDNHMPKEAERLFIGISNYKEIKDCGNSVILCHYPITCFNRHHYGSIMLYGHVHNSFEWDMMKQNVKSMRDLYSTKCRMYNVGCMIPYMNYTPRTLTEILSANNDL